MRTHTTNVPEIDFNMKYDLQRTNWKPCGLWYSIDRSWHEWCKALDFNGIGKFDYELDIEMENILRIKTFDDLILLPVKEGIAGSAFGCIDWNVIKRKYKGFEITNQYHLAFHQMFLNKSITDRTHGRFVYGLDCDGGCIWDLSAIKSVKKNKESHAN